MADDEHETDPINSRLYEKQQFGTLEKFSSLIREKLVLPFRRAERPVYYHRKFARVPTVDQCRIDDEICKMEAGEQHKRDKMVDMCKVKILRKRLSECNWYWQENKFEKCSEQRDDGEIGRTQDVYENYMKQKHRMIWLRRRHEAGDTNAKYTD
ncbi:NDUBA-like protein [Mya arenaria]|uniref:NADH dehydrogenase [ubiquinone] 1 beta subcomplex subunit 10 n=1 Tax=Mya arenaria TaxID=6604 RepID=A0ABY7DFM4_MYAAR|nr:NDUBA-like protein [Mya arenaria]